MSRLLRQWWLPASALIFLGGCRGQSGASSYLEIQREHIQALQELTEILGTVKDASSMSAALAELKKRNQRMEQIANKFRALPKPSQEVLQEIDDALGPQIRLANSRYIQEGTRISKLPGGDDFLKQLKQIK
jgi:hypothetical protein